MKSTLSGLLFVGITSAALLGACSSSKSEGDGDGDGGSGGSGGDSAGGTGGTSSGGKGGAAQGGSAGQNAGGGGAGGGMGGTGGVASMGGAGGQPVMMGGAGGGAMNPLMPVPKVEQVAMKAGVDSEGPVWVASGGYLLFSDQKGSQMFKLDPTKPAADPLRLTVFPYKNGAAKPKTNGLTIDKDGNVFACEASTKGVWKFTPPAGEPTLVASMSEGKTVGVVNDVVVSKKGLVYFTSAWNVEGGCGSAADAAYYMDANKVVKKITTGKNGVDGPLNTNGVVLSKDERTLYISDDGCYENLGGIWKYPVAEDGTPGKGVVFVSDIWVPDGLAVDDADNLYVASNKDVGRAIFVYKPDGTAWGKIAITGKNPSNVSFGDADRKTLYVTAGDTIFKIALPIPGAP